MTRLVDALRALGLEGESALGGHWVTLRGEGCAVVVVEALWGGAFYTWCDAPDRRAVESYDDPVAAIGAGLRRAGGAATSYPWPNDRSRRCAMSSPRP